MTDPAAVSRPTSPEKAPAEEPAEVETSDAKETLGAASMFILPLVTFLLIVVAWYSIGGF